MRHNALQLLAYASLAAGGLVMPLYAVAIGADTQTVGWIGAAFGLASFASSIVFGRLGDRIDRKLILQIGFLSSAAALALQFLTRTPATFLAARFAAGFALGIIFPTLAAYAYEMKRPLGKFTSYNAMGWLTASLFIVLLGSIADRTFQGPALESLRSLIVDRVGIYEFIFLTAAASCLLGWTLTLRLPSMRRRLAVPLFPTETLRKNLHVYLAVFIRHAGAAGIWTIYPLYILALGGSLAMVGWVHIVNMVSQILVLRNVERLRTLGSARWLIGIGLVLSGLTFWSFTLAHNAVQLLPLQVPLGISFACLWLGSLKEVMERNVERATATGLLNASMNLSNVLGPILGGLVAAALGFRAIMHMAALLTLFAFVLFLLMARTREPGRVVVPPLTAGPAGEIIP